MATQVAVDDLESWLQSKPANTVDTPYEIEVTGITSAKLSVFSQGLGNNTNKYVDLSETQMPLSDMLSWYLSGLTNIVEPPKLPTELTVMNGIFEGCTALKHGVTEIPEGVTDMSSVYKGCVSLVSAVIPEGITNISSTFNGCLSLTEAPVIPNGVTLAYGAFNGCSSLTTAPELPSSVVNIREIFKDCTSLIYAPLLPNGVLYVQNAFENCSALREKPILPSSVTVSTDCFKGVTTSNWKGTESQAESFLSTFFAQTVDSELQVYNDDRVTYEESIYNVDISTLSTLLAGLNPNTVSTAYKIYIRGLENIQTVEDVYAMRTAFQTYDTKYVDLSYTTVPDWHLYVYDGLFSGCFSLVIPPNFASGWTSMDETFSSCINLKEAPVIPSSVQYLRGTFAHCTSLETPAVLPSGILDTEACYAYSGVTTTGDLNKSGLENCGAMFAHCTNLTTVQNLPPNLEYMYNSMAELEYQKGMFQGCTSIESIPNVPSSIIYGHNAFKNCSSLKTIEKFGISASALDSSNFQDMFAGCTSLETIGFKVDTDKWHAWRLKFDGSSVEGKIFGIENGQIVSTAIQNTQISQDDIKLPVLTDELWFPDSIMTDSEVEDVVEDVLNNRYTYWKKTVIDPSSKSLVMMASDPDNVVSNFLGNGEGIDVEVINNSKSITLNNDKRLIADGSGITVTLNYNSKVGAVTEIYAMQACTITYYTGQSSTQSWSMSAGTKAVFIYYSGWKLHSNYGTTNTVTADNMQSVSSNAVAQAFNGFIKSYDVDYGTVNITQNNYHIFAEILPNKTIIGHNLKYWSTNSGAFSLQIYHPTASRNQPYLIANNGFTITTLIVTYYYID